MRLIACSVTFLLTLVFAGSLRAGSAETIEQAEQIRSEVQANGGSFVVTEASSTGVVDSLTLLSHPAPGARVVPAAGGVYYAICPRLARCPYPARGGANARSRVPHVMALDLARRTFARTAANLVVVSLPTRRPALLVLERGDVTSLERDELDRLTLPKIYAVGALVTITETTETMILEQISAE